MMELQATRDTAKTVLDEWIKARTRKGKLSRNTVAVGIVVLDHLRNTCPVRRDDMLSSGGEVKGARSGLARVLAAYQIPPTYLKEVTTRQGPRDGEDLFRALDWGNLLVHLLPSERDQLLLEMIDSLVQVARQHLMRENIKLRLDRRQSPSAWIHSIMDSARQRSAGVVEQHLVGAKLARKFSALDIPNHPAHAGDRQTSRSGDFAISKLVFHVTASPSLGVIDKCAENAVSGLLPVLLVPRNLAVKAQALASERGIEDTLWIHSIEDFIATNVIEIATSEGKEFFEVLREIAEIYNSRLLEVETDLSLQIQLI